PAASITTMVSLVAFATPPSVPAVGEGRTNADGLTDSRSIRVLSPRMEPPVRLEDGSTANTATRWPGWRGWSDWPDSPGWSDWPDSPGWSDSPDSPGWSPVSMVPSASMNVDLPT